MSPFTLFKKHCYFQFICTSAVTGDAAESKQDLTFYSVLVICFKVENIFRILIGRYTLNLSLKRSSGLLN